LESVGFDGGAGFEASPFGADTLGATGFGGVGFACTSFDAAGFDAAGSDAAGFDPAGFEATGLETDGLDAVGFDARVFAPCLPSVTFAGVCLVDIRKGWVVVLLTVLALDASEVGFELLLEDDSSALAFDFVAGFSTSALTGSDLGDEFCCVCTCGKLEVLSIGPFFSAIEAVPLGLSGGT